MTERPVFIPNLEGENLVTTIYLQFKWFPGFSTSQYQKSIGSLHESALKEKNIGNILEISTKSDNDVGVKSSAFNLPLQTKFCKNSVESHYQGSKVFETGGPYVDIYKKNSYESKKDERLKTSGQLIGFQLGQTKWDLTDHFYDYLYLNALNQNNEISERILNFDAFTDIAFNPKKSFNCQAYSAALYKSAILRNYDLSEIKVADKFQELFPKEALVNFQESLF
jgi:hypothetical protein